MDCWCRWREVYHNVSPLPVLSPAPNNHSIFAVSCNGEVHAGILNGPEFNFAIVNNALVVDNIPAGTVTRRDIEVPKGFIILPAKKDPVVSRLRCPNPGQVSAFKSPPVPPTSNGCGAADGISQYTPNFDFKPCCDGHDICFGTSPS